MAHFLSQNRLLNRRHFLRGLGASLALPWLDCMRPLRGAQGSDRPRRSIFIYLPNGVNTYDYEINKAGRDYELSPILSPLEALKENIMVISGLTNKASHGGDGHYFKTASWLTCTTIEKTVGSNVSSNGVSIDQVAAEEIGRSTRFLPWSWAPSP